MADLAGRALPGPLLAGFAFSAIGGPLALTALLIPDAAGGEGIASIGLVTLAGLALFAAPMLVWWRYSGEIASSGGLYTFVERAAGRRIALAHGAAWILSYFLYLPFTITELVYDQIPASFPGIRGHQTVIEIAAPIAVIAAVILAERVVMGLMLVSAVVQLGLVLALGAIVLHHSGADASAFRSHAPARPLARGAANVSLLFLCASLPLYLGGEVRGGGRALRRTMLIAVAVVGFVTIAGAFPYATLSPSLAASEVPGYDVARAYEGDGFAALIAVGGVASVAGLIFAEYIALIRLVPAMFGVPRMRTSLLIGAAFVGGCLVSLIDPDKAYEYALTPALSALYISQAFVFVAYLRFRRRPSVVDWTAAVVATVLMGFGLWVVISQQPYT
jgi:amino acid transporter